MLRSKDVASSCRWSEWHVWRCSSARSRMLSIMSVGLACCGMGFTVLDIVAEEVLMLLVDIDGGMMLVDVSRVSLKGILSVWLTVSQFRWRVL